VLSRVNTDAATLRKTGVSGKVTGPKCSAERGGRERMRRDIRHGTGPSA
jgi:hypothetical protein